MSVRDEVIDAAGRLALPPLELRSELARRCADGRIPEELALAHSELVTYCVLRERHRRWPLGTTREMIGPRNAQTGTTPVDWLMTSILGVEALAASHEIHLRHGRLTRLYTAAMRYMTPGIPGEIIDQMHRFLAELAHAADHPSAEGPADPSRFWLA